ncbi:MAG: hypothetical protein Q8Q49_00170 [bacterium]|nr:hypothetical protein [bacterium]
MATNTQDELLISWVQVSVARNFFHSPLELFNGNIFYPYTNTIAFSDLHLASAILSYVPFLISGQPITTQNVTLIFSLILLGFSSFLLTFSLSKNFLAGILTGFLVQFAPATLDKNVHLQILAIGWVLLSVYFYLKWLKKRRFYLFLIALFFFVLQASNSFLPGYFIIASFAILTLVFFIRAGKKQKPIFEKKHIAAICLSLGVVLVFALPYYRVSKEFAYIRDIREAVHLSLQPEDLYYPNNLTRLQPILAFFSNTSAYPQNAEVKVGYVGFVFSVLIIVALVYCIKRWRRLPPELLSFILIACVGLVLSFGPVLHFGRRTVHVPFPIPLPYSLLYYILPGFPGIRAVYRWEMLFILSMAVCSGVVVSQLTDKLTAVKRFALFFVLLTLVIIEYNPMRFVKVVQVSEFPEVYQFLSNQAPKEVIVEMPIYNWNMAPYATIELTRVYYSAIHKKKMINGASGFSPPPWQQLVGNLHETFPSEDTLSLLKTKGVTLIIVHVSEYDRLHEDGFKVGAGVLLDGKDVVSILDGKKSVKMVKRFGSDYVYRIL